MPDESIPRDRSAILEEEWDHIRKVLPFFFAHRGVRNQECGDLVQETLTRVLAWFEQGNKVVGKDGLQKLCYGFARNVLRENRDAALKEADELPTDVAVTSNKTTGMSTAEIQVFVHECLDRLSRTDREWILDAENMPPVRLAEKHGVSITTANVKVFRARQRFRQIVNSQEAY